MEKTRKNKLALITGASSGIGLELARIHARSGGDLIIIARDKTNLNLVKKELESKYNVKVYVIAKDLSKIESAQEIYDEVKKEGLEVDYLINNAGFGGQGEFHKRDWNKDLAMINVNITALTALTRLFLPDFIKRNSGKILNTSSTASLMPGPLQAVYYATKAYVTSFSNAIYEELSNTKITVTALLPGATETGFEKTAGLDKTDLFAHTASAYSVAKDGYNAMMRGKLEVISGLTFNQKIMFRIMKFIPKKTMLKQIHKLQKVTK